MPLLAPHRAGEDEQDTMPSDERRFRDPVHQYIPISAQICTFIDTEHFQRLKKIKQLGTSYFVWPGASHNRFEHCLGVAHLARRMATHLKKEQPELGITDRDILCVEIAGLCHDLGHGPWSHVWDGMFIPQALPGTKWQHEDASEMMFDDMLEQHNIELAPEDVTFIKALIAGDPSKCSQDEKRYLFDIVANKRNGIDVDKFDYIARDNYHIGDKDNTSFERLIHSARVIDDQICWNWKDAGHLYNVCYSRFMLHKQYYSHKTARAIEYMIVDALLLAEPYMKIAECIFDPRRYLRLTDSIMDRIQESEEPELEESRAIFRRIVTRDLYKLVDYNVLSWDMLPTLKESVTPEAIVAHARAHFAPDALGLSDHTGVDPALVRSLHAEHVIVDTSTLHYGMRQNNPLASVKFYSKQHKNTTHDLLKMPFMTIMPAHFGEVCLRVYTRDARYFGIIQAGFRALLKTLPGFHDDATDALSNGSVVPAPALTPPATEAPGTPRAFSRNASFASVASDHALAPAPANPSTPQLGGGSLPGSAGTVLSTREGSMGTARTTPFGVNPLMTVPVAYAPPSPTQESRRLRGTKRPREGEEAEPLGKKRAG